MSHAARALALFLSLSSGVSAAADGPLGEAERGARVYTERCLACHGPAGLGDGPASIALDPKPRDFTDTTKMHALTDEALVAVITGGGASAGKSPLMPAWGPTLTEREIRDVAAFVRAFAGPPPTP
jgi:mono/diheme cytochrome c family protein